MVLKRLKKGLTRQRPEPHDREDRIIRTETPGAAPGTLTVEPDSVAPVMRVVAFGADELTEQKISDPAELVDLIERFDVTWLNVDGLGDTDLIRQLGDMFDLHALTLEDLVHVDQRAKVEAFPSYMFIVARMVYLGEALETEQLSLLVGDGFVLTFQEGHPGDCLDPVRGRLRNDVGRLRRSGAGYLAYALIDAVTDHYYPVLARYGEQLDAVEDEVISGVEGDLISRIHDLKRDLSTLKRSIAPQREALATLSRETTPLIDEQTRLHLRDVSDHTVQLVDLIDSYREVASSLVDTYLSLAGHRMNEIMKVLTVIGALFIPLTFITGLYGMNFNSARSPYNMPELNFRYGYPAVLGVMLLVTVVLLGYFARRGWIGKKR